MLDYIIYCIIYILLSYAFLLIFENILGYEKKIKNYTVFFVFLMSSVLAVSTFQTFDLMGNLSFFAKILVAFFYLSHRIIAYSIILNKFNKSIIYISFIHHVLLEFYSPLINSIIKTSLIRSTIISLLIETISVFFFIVFIKKYNLQKIIQKNIKCIKPTTYIVMLLFTLFFSMFINILNDKSEYRSLFISIASVTILIIPATILLIVKTSISDKAHEETSILLLKQLENQVEYYEKINSIYSEFRSFRHDYNNHILCLKSILEENDIPQALDYLSDIQTFSSIYKNQYNTGNIIMDALLNDKNEKAQKYNTYLEFSGYIPTSGISNVDLCIIFANSLDNAVEACVKSDKNLQKKISINADFKQGYFFLTVSNPYFEEIQIKKDIFITSKNDSQNHGIGISNIKKTVKKYSGNTNIEIENNIFNLSIELLLNQDIK